MSTKDLEKLVLLSAVVLLNLLASEKLEAGFSENVVSIKRAFCVSNPQETTTGESYMTWIEDSPSGDPVVCHLFGRRQGPRQFVWFLRTAYDFADHSSATVDRVLSLDEVHFLVERQELAGAFVSRRLAKALYGM